MAPVYAATARSGRRVRVPVRIGPGPRARSPRLRPSCRERGTGSAWAEKPDIVRRQVSGPAQQPHRILLAAQLNTGATIEDSAPWHSRARLRSPAGTSARPPRPGLLPAMRHRATRARSQGQAPAQAARCRGKDIIEGNSSAVDACRGRSRIRQSGQCASEVGIQVDARANIRRATHVGRLHVPGQQLQPPQVVAVGLELAGRGTRQGFLLGRQQADLERRDNLGA